MNRFRLVFQIVLISLFVVSSLVMAGERQTVDLSSSAVNGAPLFGPEGIVIADGGDMYVSNRDGKIMRITSDGTTDEFTDLNNLVGKGEEYIRGVGLAMDKNGDIYAASFANGGSVMKVIGPGKPESGKVTLYRRGIGSANFILIDDEIMYVSDSSMRSGRVFRFDMSDEKLIGSAADTETELLGTFSYANGLALGPEKKWLYVAETTKGHICRVNLATKESEVFVEFGGWADGVTFDPERNLLFACDNRGGRIVAIDLSGKVVGDVHLIGKEGQCAPACLVFPDPDTIVFTDLWKASLWRALLKRGQYHSYIYRLSVDDVVKSAAAAE